MGTLWQDLRFAVRTLLKKPAFTAVAIFSLTLGIGANTTVFTLVKAVFLQSIPVKEASRVVAVYSTQMSKDGIEMKYILSSYLNAMDYREKNDVCTGLSLFQFTGAPLGIAGKTTGVGVQMVNWDFFDILGVQPVMGRSFLPEEDKVPGAKPVVVVSYALWNSQLGADPNIVGKTVLLADLPFTVVGVAPSDFHNVAALQSPDLWVPMMMHDAVMSGPLKTWYPRRSYRMLNMVARLKPGVSVAQAQASLESLALHLAQAYPKENSGRSVILMPLDQTNVPPNQHGLFALAGTLMSAVVGLILLIACGNVANLLLTRATQRRRELAVRLSLGASRQRLIRQLLTEGLLLGLVSAALGIVLAYWSKDLVWKLLPANQRPRGLDTTLDLRVLLYTLGISIGATAIFALIPAWQASKTSQMTALKDRGDAPSATGKWYGLRGALVMGQVALSLVALVGAGLFIHSLKNAQQMDPGFEVKHELITFVSPGELRYTPAQAEQFYHDVVERVKSLPAVAAAGISDYVPMFNGSLQGTLFPDNADMADPRNGKLTPIPIAEPGFFQAAGISMLRGRDFNDHDDASAPQVGIINRALADLFWPGKDPVGRHLRFHSASGQDSNVQVIGVVKTAKYQTLGEPPQPTLYLSMKQVPDLNAILYVQTKGDPSAAMTDVRATISAVDSKMNTNANQTLLMSDVMQRNLLGPRFGAELLAGFAGLALLLAAIGTYGVMAYSVSQRTQEIGIRMALGAQRTDVLRMVLGSGMAMVFGGVAAGFAISWMLTSTVSGLLYGIESFDAPSFFVMAALLIAVAFFACWLPARRAMRVDPMIALRYE